MRKKILGLFLGLFLGLVLCLAPLVWGSGNIFHLLVAGQKLNFDAQTGSYTPSNGIIGAASGATATIVGVADSGTVGTLILTGISGTFQDNEIIYESALGGELILNGDCSVDSFTKGPGWAHDAGNEEYDCDGSQGGPAGLVQSVVNVGHHRVVFTVKNYFAGNIFSYITSTITSYAANGTYTDYGSSIIPGQFGGMQGDVDFIGSVDDISIKKLTNAALANGTVY